MSNNPEGFNPRLKFTYAVSVLNCYSIRRWVVQGRLARIGKNQQQKKDHAEDAVR